MVYNLVKVRAESVSSAVPNPLMIYNLVKVRAEQHLRKLAFFWTMYFVVYEYQENFVFCATFSRLLASSKMASADMYI